jgi:TonB family protein
MNASESEVRRGALPPELDPRRGGMLLKRALLLRCPHCGGRDVRDGWFATKRRCPSCAIRLDRGEHDFFIGAYLVNLIVAELAAAGLIALVVAAFWPDVPWTWLLRGGVVLMIAMPIVFYPFSRFVWLAVDLMFQPAAPRDFDATIDGDATSNRYSEPMKPNLSLVLLALMLGTLAACSEAPVPIEHPQPMPGASPFEYPIALWDQRVQGETLLLVHVTAVGDVDSARVYTSSGVAELDSAAVAGAFKLRFAPARQGDRRVPMWTKVPVRFSVDSVATKLGLELDR